MNTSQLEKIARNIRSDILRSLCEAASGHTGGSLGLADIFTALYFNILRHDPKNQQWEERDRLILSIGHVAPVLYTTLAHAGYFSKTELSRLRKLGSRLQGHPGREHGLPGLELSAGSLGQGLSVAVGMALSAKLDHKTWRIFSIHGDGELQEGSIWEAAMSAAHYKLDNLIVVVDRNGVQIDGKTCDVMEIEPLNKKWEAFGWNVLECDGHNFTDILSTFEMALEIKDKPKVIIAHTTMGKGVKEIEGDYTWHGKAPNKEETERFIKELEVGYGEL
ncbi:MAG: transketolase [Bacteroidales bacterium]|nr:transketolase [Bacteroidales bacterium]MCF8405931.1 transketolase [Bacteroidales bacterium]